MESDIGFFSVLAGLQNLAEHSVPTIRRGDDAMMMMMMMMMMMIASL